jgi:hypothetical protein
MWARGSKGAELLERSRHRLIHGAGQDIDYELLWLVSSIQVLRMINAQALVAL